MLKWFKIANFFTVYYLFFHRYQYSDGERNIKFTVWIGFHSYLTSMTSNYSKYSYIMKMVAIQSYLWERYPLPEIKQLFEFTVGEPWGY